MTDADEHIAFEYHNLSKLVHREMSPELRRVLKLYETQPGMNRCFLHVNNPYLARAMADVIPTMFQNLKNIAMNDDSDLLYATPEPAATDLRPRNAFGLTLETSQAIRAELRAGERTRPVPLVQRTPVLRTDGKGLTQSIELQGGDVPYWLDALTLYLQDIPPSKMVTLLGGNRALQLMESFKNEPPQPQQAR